MVWRESQKWPVRAIRILGWRERSREGKDSLDGGLNQIGFKGALIKEKIFMSSDLK